MQAVDKIVSFEARAKIHSAIGKDFPVKTWFKVGLPIELARTGQSKAETTYNLVGYRLRLS